MSRKDLVLHVDATRVTLEDLEQVPMPEPLGPRHVPVHPAKWVKALQRAVTSYGFQVNRLELGANQKRSRLFGVMDLQLGGEEMALGRGITLGFRGSTDQSLGNALVGGERVFVCDNLALSGDMVFLSRKSTSGFSPVQAFEEGLEKFDLGRKIFAQTIEKAQEKNLSKSQAESLLWQLFGHGVLPKKLMGPVEDVWLRKPEGSGVVSDTLWDLHNAGTFCLKEENSVTRWDRSTRLGAFLSEAVVTL